MTDEDEMSKSYSSSEKYVDFKYNILGRPDGKFVS